jgi:hypothetical protein
MTDEDAVKLERAAERFCARHNIRVDDDDTALLTIEAMVTGGRRCYGGDPERAGYLARLWRRCHIRATGCPDHGYGYVGTIVN